MPHRTFTDAAGREWQVWDVYPAARSSGREQNERRFEPRRQVEQGPPQAELERRGYVERRALVSPGLEQGWLAFMSGEDKRRVVPIPREWVDGNEETLRTLLAKSVVVTQRTFGANPGSR